MSDLADLYDAIRKEISPLVTDLDDEQLALRVPATPDWTIRDIVSHLTGDAVCVLAGDFPREFFENLGAAPAITTLNAWTNKQVADRRGRPLSEVLAEWETAIPPLIEIMRTNEWPEGVFPFAGHVLLTDIATHQQDIYGALGIVRDRESPQIRVGVATFIGGIGLRTQMTGGPSFRVVMEDKDVPVGGDEPQATLRAPRFELFRALSGRRNPDQIRGFDWDGDPEPFIPLFYPYGIREDALVE